MLADFATIVPLHSKINEKETIFEGKAMRVCLRCERGRLYMTRPEQRLGVVLPQLKVGQHLH